MALIVQAYTGASDDEVLVNRYGCRTEPSPKAHDWRLGLFVAVLRALMR